MQDIPSKENKPFRWVGTRPVRPDGVPKVTGRAMYGSDMSMPGMLVGRILRSPHAHARIRSIDIAKAAALPGVKAVVTSADFPEQPFAYVGPERVAQNFWHMTRNIMAREKVLYEGHAVAAVAAASTAVADEALSLIEVDYEVLPHVIDVDAAMRPDAPLLFPDITYSFYPVYCALYGIRYEEVPLDAAMRVQIADFRRPCSAILLPNPNAPTGIGLSRKAIEALVAEHPDQLVVIDEAYVDFGAESAVSLVARYDNLLIVQTLSKSRALAGLRVGFAIGQRPLIEALERVKGSFNSYPLDCLAIAGAVAAIKDDAWFEETRERIIANRESLVHALSELGFEVLPSVANFVFARHRSRGGAHLAAELRERGVLVRHFQKPRIEDFLRITVGTEDQCSRLIALAKSLI